MDTSVNNADATYNRFFYTTVCHICKKFDNVVLKRCSGCKMIFYCTHEHQKEHWSEHKDLCKAIRYVRGTYTTGLSISQGTNIMMRLLQEKVICKLQRRLKTYEVQMFNYPRMCLVCKNLNGQIEHCSHCMAVWFCTKHKINHDSDTCNLLKLCFKSDLLLSRKKSVNLTVAFIQHTSYEKEFSNMKEYIDIYGDDENIRPDTSSDLLKIEQSMYLTRPLTVLFGMRVLDYIPMYKDCRKSLVIHVISSSKCEILNLPEWEILLHFFTNLKCLTLVLIGSKLDQTNRQELCEVCQQNEKEFLVHSKK